MSDVTSNTCLQQKRRPVGTLVAGGVWRWKKEKRVKEAAGGWKEAREAEEEETKKSSGEKKIVKSANICFFHLHTLALSTECTHKHARTAWG